MNRKASLGFMVSTVLILATACGSNAGGTLQTGVPLTEKTTPGLTNPTKEITITQVPTAVAAPVFNVYVTDIEKADTYTGINGYKSSPAREGWEYVAVTYIIENTSDVYVGSADDRGTIKGIAPLVSAGKYRYFSQSQIPFRPKRIVSNTGNEYTPTEFKFSLASAYEEFLLPPGYRLKVLTAFEVPKNQTGLVMEFVGKPGEIDPLRVDLDTISLASNIQLPETEQNDVEDFKLGETWKLDGKFNLTFNDVDTEAKECGAPSDNPNKKEVFLRATIENLAGQDISPDDFRGWPIYSDWGYFDENPFIVCHDTSDNIAPGQKTEIVYRSSVPKGVGNFRVFLAYRDRDTGEAQAKFVELEK